MLTTDDLALERLAGLAGLLEARGDDHHGAHALAAARFERGEHVRLRHGDDRQVHRVGDVLDGGVALHAVHDRRLRVHREHLSLELERQQVVQDAAADAAAVARGADDGDRAGMEEQVQ